MQSEVAEHSGDPKRVELVREVCEYIQENLASKVTLALLGEKFGVSPYHLQRIFADVMGISPRKYLEECRLSVLKLRLAKGEPVLNALRGTGYSSQSWLYEDSRVRLGMTPATYRKGGSGTLITYATGNSPIGHLLVAATEHGICSVNAGATEKELVAALRREYPRAQIAKSNRAMRFLKGVNRHLRGQEARLPLDIKGTEFQLRVWSALQRIPLGETRSYSDVAGMIGKPEAVRAVGNACASNPVPLIIPCHRVIRENGSLGGYGLGLKRKRTLLARERNLAAK
ncbi:MAG TPA: methylated-DNA--[protein]-cysteine S-methyltransferase [Nitrososphaerales archaeon]|nr:methylated-DNA--[protein]-cysteine S-methyltransferase [Nitrososphaerales archaeon]